MKPGKKKRKEIDARTGKNMVSYARPGKKNQKTYMLSQVKKKRIYEAW